MCQRIARRPQFCQRNSRFIPSIPALACEPAAARVAIVSQRVATALCYATDGADTTHATSALAEKSAVGMARFSWQTLLDQTDAALRALLPCL